MCFFKSEKIKYSELVDHYNASFQSIDNEIELIKEKFSTLLAKDPTLKSIGMGQINELGSQMTKYTEKDALPATLTKPELTELRWHQRFLSAYSQVDSYNRFYENGFDFFPTHVVTAGEPDKFKLFNWGLVPFYMKEKDKAMQLRLNTLNCIHEEMWEKASFRDAIRNNQRCLIPVTGFFEWRWLDAEGTVKIPYHVTFRDQKVRSIAGIYSRWKDPSNGEYYYSYSVLTCPANTIMEYVHNNKKRMPVFIDKENERDWLNKDLSKDDVMDLCKPNNDPSMRAYTISKLLTTRNVNINVPDVLAPFNYNTAIKEANEYLLRGDRKKAMEVFKSSISGEKVKEEHLQLAASQDIVAELG